MITCSLQERRSPLHLAVEEGNMDIVNILLTHGANVDSVRNSTYYYNQLQVLQYYWIISMSYSVIF